MKLEARTTSNAEVSAQYGGNYRYTVVNDRTVLIDPSSVLAGVLPRSGLRKRSGRPERRSLVWVVQSMHQLSWRHSWTKIV